MEEMVASLPSQKSCNPRSNAGASWAVGVALLREDLRIVLNREVEHYMLVVVQLTLDLLCVFFENEGNCVALRCGVAQEILSQLVPPFSVLA